MKLFIPGPINVAENINKAMCKEMIGHRSSEFKDLMEECTSGLKTLLYTNNPIVISTSSGTGLMEGTIRSCVNENVLVCVCGAFGKKWAQIAQSCGKEVDILSIEEGQPISSKLLKEKLEEKKYEAVCITFNETSTGVENNLAELVPIVKESGALVFVDAVSAMAGSKIEVDKLGIDVCLASSQKCFALPPGLAVASVSEAAIEKAKTVSARGYYFDLVELVKGSIENQTPYTPAVGLMFGLRQKLADIFEEDLEVRFNRHRELAKRTRDWAVENGFELFAEEGYQSNTITCITNTKGIDMKKVKEKMQEKGYFIDTGYRKLNEKLIEKGLKGTFRIPHMGELTIEELNEFLNTLKETMEMKE